MPFPLRHEMELVAQALGIDSAEASGFFKYGRTGVVGQCFQDQGVSDQAVAWVYDEWLKSG